MGKETHNVHLLQGKDDVPIECIYRRFVGNNKRW